MSNTYLIRGKMEFYPYYNLYYCEDCKAGFPAVNLMGHLKAFHDLDDLETGP